jgi:hypothetical protein
MRRVLIAVSTVGVLLAACGGSDRAETLDAPPTATSTPAASTTTATEAATSSAALTSSTAGDVDEPATTETAALETSEDLEGRLLAIEDLPTGWSSMPYEDESDGGDCDDAGIVDTADAAAGVAFSQGSFGPFLTQALTRFGSDAAASAALVSFRDFAERCQTYTTTEDDGSTSTATLSPLSFPDLADDTYALRLTVEAALPLSGDVIVVRQGRVLMLLAHVGIGSIESSVTEDVTRRAVEKLGL